MTIQSVLGLVLALTIFVASPGPGVFAVIARALSHGFLASLSFIIGVILGDLTYLVFAILGLSAIATAFGHLFVIVRILGGLYLIYLGIKSWRSAKNISKELLQTKAQGLVGGLLLTLANPKVILFYLGFLPSFVDLNDLSLQTGLSLVLIVAAVIFTVLTSYAFFASKLRGFFQNDSARSNLQRGSAAFLMSVGLLVILKK